MIQRRLRTVPLGEGGRRYMVTLIDDPHPNAEARRFEFLRELVTDGVYSGLLACGPLQFERLRMYRENDHWVVEVEAEELGTGGYDG